MEDFAQTDAPLAIETGAEDLVQVDQRQLSDGHDKGYSDEDLPGDCQQVLPPYGLPTHSL